MKLVFNKDDDEKIKNKVEFWNKAHLISFFMLIISGFLAYYIHGLSSINGFILSAPSVLLLFAAFISSRLSDINNNLTKPCDSSERERIIDLAKKYVEIKEYIAEINKSKTEVNKKHATAIDIWLKHYASELIHNELKEIR